VVLGIASGSVIVPILLELVQAVKDEVGPKPGANEKASALFALFGALGSILATIIGSILFYSFENRVTSDIFAILSFLMAIIFFLANIKPAFLRKKKPAEVPAPAVA
jgi:MFS family permease